MPQPFDQLPRALRERARFERFDSETEPEGGIPVLLAHPDEGWDKEGARPLPRPVVLWFHGRTVSKELDPGRYLRWQRAGIATCAVDLPGHGERLNREMHTSEWTLRVVEQCVSEIDRILAVLGDRRFNGAFDLTKLAIGGMSAGGMVTLVRLCAGHPFVCAAVESTAGDFEAMAGRAFYDEPRVRSMNPAARLDGWRDIPLLALHSEADEWVPVEAIRSFTEDLAQRPGADVTLHTWPTTGAPYEHAGFGRVANEAKNLLTDFLVKHLAPPAL